MEITAQTYKTGIEHCSYMPLAEHMRCRLSVRILKQDELYVCTPIKNCNANCSRSRFCRVPFGNKRQDKTLLFELAFSAVLPVVSFCNDTMLEGGIRGGFTRAWGS